MLNQLNNSRMSLATRKKTFERAMYCNPYWYLLQFPIVAGGTGDIQLQDRAEINEDFVLTEMRANFGDVFDNTGALFNVDVFTQNKLTSLLNYSHGLLPSPFQFTEARFDTAVPNQIFDDRQREFMPILIKKNDRVIAEIRNTQIKGGSDTARIALIGYNTSDYRYLTTNEQDWINQSLDRPVRFEYFTFEVTQDGFKDFFIENDKTPRLIIGFGATNSEQSKSDIPQVMVQIEDLAKRTQFMNRPIPLEYIAPRLTCLLDEHIYYFPIEYYFEPKSAIKFSIENTPSAPAPPVQGFFFHILTRTV